jgi:phospholipid-binding lipoprotein MlaA
MISPHFFLSSIESRNALTGIMLGLMAVLVVGCASGPGAQDALNKSDPYENINRKVYTFNDKVDDYVAKPVSDAYKVITPDFMQTGVRNFFNNIKDINVVLNDMLQGKVQQGAQDTGRLLMNSTLGMAGLFDVASTVGLNQNDEDFEQTLAVWGVPQGSYLVLPLLGPMTARGIPGAVFDTAANPITYIGAPVQALSLINTRANAEGSLKFIDEASLDPYVFTRESFLQWRTHLATDGKNENSTTDLTDIEADLLNADDNNGKTAALKTDGNKLPADTSTVKPTLDISAPDAQPGNSLTPNYSTQPATPDVTKK